MKRFVRIYFLALILAGCPKPPADPIPCPILTADFNLSDIGVLKMGDSAAGELVPFRFKGHTFGVPKPGAITVTVSVKLDDPNLKPLLFLYGPRAVDGVFGRCVAEHGRGEAGNLLELSYEVEAGKGGDYLVLVGTHPPSAGQGGYVVSASCAGSGCEDTTCPTLEELECSQTVCPGGFVSDKKATGVNCPTCRCEQRECGPFQKLVFDRCVCDCPAPDPGKAVCGADGKTWPSACHAICNEVAVANKDGACESVCEPLQGCGLDCEHGLKVANGCNTCECATLCDKAPPYYQPVCGNDGLTYTNIARAHCNGKTVDYVGPCLPFCERPKDCNLTCELGFVPAVGILDQCFECKCMAPQPTDTPGDCSPKSPMWCARKIGADLGPIPPGIGAVVWPLPKVRTFINKCAALAAGWKPFSSSACGTGICENKNDCVPAQAVFDANAVAAGLEVDRKVKCHKGLEGTGKAKFGACRLQDDLPKQCPDAGCPAGATCINVGKEKRCVYTCPCLNTPGSRIYDPVCVGGDTYYNACFAFCGGAWPVEYPGRCCEPRQPIEDITAAYSAIHDQCQQLGGLQVDFRFDNACPPTPESCNEPGNKEVCCKPIPGLE